MSENTESHSACPCPGCYAINEHPEQTIPLHLVVRALYIASGIPTPTEDAMGRSTVVPLVPEPLLLAAFMADVAQEWADDPDTPGPAVEWTEDHGRAMLNPFLTEEGRDFHEMAIEHDRSVTTGTDLLTDEDMLKLLGGADDSE